MNQTFETRHFLTTLETHLSRSEQALHDDVASHSRQAAVTDVWLATIGWLDTSGKLTTRSFVHPTTESSVLKLVTKEV